MAGVCHASRRARLPGPLGRKMNGRGRADALDTFEIQPTAVQRDQPINEREVEPGALGRVVTVLNLFERLTHAADVLGRDADAGIDDRGRKPPVGGDAYGYPHAPPAFRKLDRVRQQIDEDLFQGARIADDTRRDPREFRLEEYPVLRRLHLDELQRIGDDVAQMFRPGF